MNKIIFIIISLLCVIYIISEVRKKRFSIKESFWWLFASIIMMILSIFPQILDFTAKKLNISYPPSLLFLLSVIFLILINFKFSKRISELEQKNIELSQNLSIIKEQLNGQK